MTALEELIRAGLHAYDPLALRAIREPYGVDATVFGPEQPERPQARQSLIHATCRTHAVEWGGYGVECWCCEAGLPGVKKC